MCRTTFVLLWHVQQSLEQAIFVGCGEHHPAWLPASVSAICHAHKGLDKCTVHGSTVAPSIHITVSNLRQSLHARMIMLGQHGPFDTFSSSCFFLLASLSKSTLLQVREVIAYAKERFIEIVPEIELPGHCGAALASYPYLGCRGSPPPPPSPPHTHPPLSFPST